jgi:hypothetical protein
MRKQLALFTLIGLFFGTSPASAQLISFGAKGGAPLTTPTFNGDGSPHYTVGPSIELRLHTHFAIEVDALYQRTSSTSSFATIPAGSSTGSTLYNTSIQKGNAWQLPVLGKYYFGTSKSKWRPYVGTGYSLTTTWYHTQGSASILSGTNLVNLTNTTPYSVHSRSPIDVGLLVAAGVRYKVGRYALMPEFRYNYWGANSYPMRNNSATFLLGFQF